MNYLEIINLWEQKVKLEFQIEVITSFVSTILFRLWRIGLPHTEEFLSNGIEILKSI